GEDSHENDSYCSGNCRRGRRWRRRLCARLSLASHHDNRAVSGGRADGYACAHLERAHADVARPARDHRDRDRRRRQHRRGPCRGAGPASGGPRPRKAAPEGYTLSMGNWTSHVGAGAMYPAAHDAVLELQPVSRISATPLMIVGKNALPPKSARELIAWLKADPGKASAATVGAGSAAHVCLLYFQQKTGTSFQLVPYRGGAPVMQDLVAGQIDMFCAEASQTLSFVRSGAIRAFAVMSKERWPAAPDVPTMDEVGVSGMYISFWNG